jgi:hypothetical protein
MLNKRNILIGVALLLLGGIAYLIWLEYGHMWTDREGAQLGLYAGGVIGAIALPIVRDPTVSGRVLVGAVVGLLLMGFIQLLEFSQLMQGAPGFMGTGEMALLGQFGLSTFMSLLYGVGGGILLALLLTAPQWVLVGALAGVVVGALLGAAAYALLLSQGISLSRNLFLLLVGLLTFSLFAMLGFSND